jgi:hypothetical protein
MEAESESLKQPMKIARLYTPSNPDLSRHFISMHFFKI